MTDRNQPQRRPPRAEIRRQPREQRRADRHVAAAAERLERGYTTPRLTLADRLAMALGRRGGQLARPKRSRLANGNPPGRLATKRRIARTRRT